MKSMVWVGKIIALDVIPDADKIVAATVVCGSGGKWHGVVKKEDFKVGDLCEVFLPDSLLPETPEFEFMRKFKFRVRMCRLRGSPSEVLIMPLSAVASLGDDITMVRKVLKYEKPIDASVGGEVYGNFPAFIPKTDELNFQTAHQLVDALAGKLYYVTVKCDGSSGTMYKFQGHFGCCSRNLELKETPTSLPWLLARKYNLVDKMPDGFAIQFEMCGGKIQGNPMGLKEPAMFVFNLYEIGQGYKSLDALNDFCEAYGLPQVPLVESPTALFPANISDAELQSWAKGTYPNGKQREGIVIRPIHEQMVGADRLTFKVINLDYKE